MLTSNLKPLAGAKTQEGKDTKLRAESTRANSAFSFSSVVSPLEKKKSSQWKLLSAQFVQLPIRRRSDKESLLSHNVCQYNMC